MSKKLAGIVLAAGILGSSLAGPSNATDARVRIPHCAEDEGFLVGLGDFSNGRWERYDCVRPESFAAMAREDGGLARAVVEGFCEDRRRWWYRQYGLSIISEGCDRAGAR